MTTDESFGALAEAVKHIDPDQKALILVQKSVQEEKLKHVQDIAAQLKKENHEIDIRNAKQQLQSITTFLANADQFELSIDEVQLYKEKRKQLMTFLALSNFQA